MKAFKPVILAAALAGAITMVGCSKIPTAPETTEPQVLKEHVKSGLPYGSDVYEALQYLNYQRDRGIIDGFKFVEEGELAFYVWKRNPKTPGGTLMRMEMRGHIFRDIKASRIDELPPSMR